MPNTGSLTTVTGLGAISRGAVLIITAGVFSSLDEITAEGVMATLGPGFTHAVATLRDVVAQAAARAAAADAA